MSVGFCRHYTVEAGAVVLGNVWTDATLRGHGLAEALLGRAVGASVARGRRVFYIDTREDNAPMRAVIARLGFGEPVHAIEPYD